MDDCHSWGFIQTWVRFSGLVWACMSLYCHVHWVEILFPCSFNLQERWRPGLKGILKRWCPVHKRNWQPWMMAISYACKIREDLSLNLFIKEGVLHSAFGASTFYSAKDLPFATAFPLQLCHLSLKLLGQSLPSCPHAHSLILLFSWPCTSILCYCCYVRR